ncbi:hypothetical protein ACRALDRAFT_210519 [Sodiomyces alcalophilus JCM 7366]|uniref:uncharacterized protein n=1 Tax=Sodiomyces alcalophilus JCM 7366 TaxID=591952 RepID=UPI0039B6AC80
MTEAILSARNVESNRSSEAFPSNECQPRPLGDDVWVGSGVSILSSSQYGLISAGWPSRRTGWRDSGRIRDPATSIQARSFMHVGFREGDNCKVQKTTPYEPDVGKCKDSRKASQATTTFMAAQLEVPSPWVQFRIEQKAPHRQWGSLSAGGSGSAIEWLASPKRLAVKTSREKQKRGRFTGTINSPKFRIQKKGRGPNHVRGHVAPKRRETETETQTRRKRRRRRANNERVIGDGPAYYAAMKHMVGSVLPTVQKGHGASGSRKSLGGVGQKPVTVFPFSEVGDSIVPDPLITVQDSSAAR